MTSPRSTRKWHGLLVAVSSAVASLAGLSRAQAQPTRLRITFQPDCFRSSLSAACDPRKSGMRLDLGPQIAVWLESADGSRFVDTLLVTNLVANLGIGNRPGHYTLPSGPKFPYGRRLSALPYWAHRRGKLYDSVLIQDGDDKEFWLGFHESVSSPDPYFCRPMTLGEIDVDAISCPTQRFNSAKGRFFDPKIDLAAPNIDATGKPKDYVPSPKTYYPPRNDLRTFTRNDCDDDQNQDIATCPLSSKRYADLNDLDAVAAATPPYGRPFNLTWRVPDELADGDYAVLVEVSKEFDGNAANVHPSYQDPLLREWGLTNNVGQPSVIFRVPFTLTRGKAVQAATSTISGYGDWDGLTGTLHAPDSTISSDPGSGIGRLLTITQPTSTGGSSRDGRVHVAVEAGSVVVPPPVDASAPSDGASTEGGAGDALRPDGGATASDARKPPPSTACEIVDVGNLSVASPQVNAETAQVTFVEPSGAAWAATDQYEVRLWSGADQSDDAFDQGRPQPRLDKVAPGNTMTVSLASLRSQSMYTVGVRAVGDCLERHVGYTTFMTIVRTFTQLSGCFIATAAYGSPLAADVSLLRAVRDRAQARSSLAAAAVDAYEQSSPPVADVLRGSEPARAVARTLLAPLVELVRAAARPGR